MWNQFLLHLIISTHSSAQHSPIHGEAIDISHHNGEINWLQLRPETTGISRIMIKASQGTSYKDPNFVDNVVQACKAGFEVGAYHFVTFTSNSSAVAQMKNLQDQMKKANYHYDAYLAKIIPSVRYGGLDFYCVRARVRQILHVH